MYIKNVTSF